MNLQDSNLEDINEKAMQDELNEQQEELHPSIRGKVKVPKIKDSIEGESNHE